MNQATLWFTLFALVAVVCGQQQFNNNNRFNNQVNNNRFNQVQQNRFNNNQVQQNRFNNNQNRFNQVNNRRPVNNNNNVRRPAPVNNVRRPVNNNNNVRRPVNNNNNVRRPVNNNNVRRPAPVAARTAAQGFRATPANARDGLGNEVYPGCNGTVCLPEANLCAARKTKAGHFSFGGKSYWYSPGSDEAALRNARWNWFTGRNYCRKMCMDMVAIESLPEQNFITDLMSRTNVQNLHLAGRLCDAEVEGCNQTRFQPLNINGWFWASTLKMMPPTNMVSTNQVFNNWVAGQPNGAIKADGFGVEACLALALGQPGLGNAAWTDEACGTRRHLICEDLPVANINFVRQNNPNVNIP